MKTIGMIGGTGWPSTLEYYRIINQETNRRLGGLNSAKIIKKLSLNRGLFSTLHNTLQKWLADDYYNTDKFFKDFNFQTKVSLEEGMQREVVWYKAKLLE